MRTIEYGTPSHVPAFLTKLWKLVTDKNCDDLIRWSPNGSSFIIFDEIRFSKELLPMYFKHNNMASFVRQLNMYGFRKLSCIDQGGMHCYRSEIEFYHQYFSRGNEEYLERIKRKIPNSKSDDPKVKQEYIDELNSVIRSLSAKVQDTEQGMRHMRREHRMLWRHVHLLTDESAKQKALLQQVRNTFLPFIMNMVRSSREVALKRKAHLMLDEGSVQNKVPRLSSPYYVEHSDQDQITNMPTSPGNVTNRGPVIHDVTELEGNKMYAANILCSANTSTKESEAIVDSPLSCNLESSEQTIDNPYTEQGSLERLNILNHNYERSNSVSPQIEMKHSPISVTATSPFHMPSHTISSPHASGSSCSGSRGMSPVTYIDETTSDVPMPGSGLMAHPFVPKMEDTCSNSGMYWMNATTMQNDRMPLMSRRTAFPNKPSPPMMAEGMSSSSAIPENTVASTENKCLPNSFETLPKNVVPNMPWVSPPETEGTEANIENWLGQIFKCDNLIPGLSLPQKVPQQSFETRK